MQQSDDREVATTANDAGNQKIISRRELGRIALIGGAAFGVGAMWPKAWQSPLVQIGPLPAHACVSVSQQTDTPLIMSPITTNPLSDTSIAVSIRGGDCNDTTGRRYSVTLQWSKDRNAAVASRSSMGLGTVDRSTATQTATVTGLTANTVYYFWASNQKDTSSVAVTQPATGRTFGLPVPTVTVDATPTSGPTLNWTVPSGASAVEIIGRRVVGGSTEEISLGVISSYRTSLMSYDRPTGWQTAGFTFRIRAVNGGLTSAWVDGTT